MLVLALTNVDYRTSSEDGLEIITSRYTAGDVFDVREDFRDQLIADGEAADAAGGAVISTPYEVTATVNPFSMKSPEGLPRNAPGYLHNDGFGNLIWSSQASSRRATIIQNTTGAWTTTLPAATGTGSIVEFYLGSSISTADILVQVGDYINGTLNGTFNVSPNFPAGSIIRAVDSGYLTWQVAGSTESVTGSDAFDMLEYPDLP